MPAASAPVQITLQPERNPGVPLLPSQASTNPVVENATHPGTEPDEVSQLRSVEANSGAAFVRKLALALDPDSAPRLQLFAWNLFLGARSALGHIPRVMPLIDLMTESRMQDLAQVYLAKIDPCYGFIEREQLLGRISQHWSTSPATHDRYHAVLCGIAALGLLYSCRHTEPLEADLAETAKHILEHSSEPSIEVVTGWILRVAYLRMTATAHTAWLASCTMMHVIEASGIHSARPVRLATSVSTDLSSRIIGIARHLNVWTSFDIGRSRVHVPHLLPLNTSARSLDFTTELLGLLPQSESLDPGKDISIMELKDSLEAVLVRRHTEAPSVLAQCNLVLCLTRRLRALDFVVAGGLLAQILALASRAVQCAQDMLNSCNPWHHVANIPFQIVCILLAIDTAQSQSQLTDSMKVLANAADLYRTDAIRDALDNASLLILLHQKRKTSDAKMLADIVHMYSPTLLNYTQTGTISQHDSSLPSDLLDSCWLDDLMTDLPGIQNFDVGQLLNDNYQSELLV